MVLPGAEVDDDHDEYQRSHSAGESPMGSVVKPFADLAIEAGARIVIGHLERVVFVRLMVGIIFVRIVGKHGVFSFFGLLDGLRIRGPSLQLSMMVQAIIRRGENCR
jgi:hypothetical protein